MVGFSFFRAVEDARPYEIPVAFTISMCYTDFTEVFFMKKRIWLRVCMGALAVGLAIACAGCSLPNDAIDNDGKESSAPLSDTQSTEQQTSTTTVPREETPTKRVSLADRYLDEVETAYDADANLSEYQSTAGMCELNDKYAKRWQEIADEYYDKLMAYEYDFETPFCDVEEFRSALADMKANHEEYVEKEMDAYVSVVKYEFQGGSISGVVISSHRCKLEEEWALKILDICDMLGIE